MKGYRPNPTDAVLSINKDAQLLVFIGLTGLAEDRSAPRQARSMARALSVLLGRASEVYLVRDKRKHKT